VGTQQASRIPVVTTERVWRQTEADRPYWHCRTLASICTLSLATLSCCEKSCVRPSVYLSLTDIDFWLMFSLSPSEHHDTKHVPRFLQTNTTIQHMFVSFSKRPPRYGTRFSVYVSIDEDKLHAYQQSRPCHCKQARHTECWARHFQRHSRQQRLQCWGFCSQISPDRSVRRQASDVMGFYHKFKQKLKNQTRDKL
jgi:hypothetical protein